MRLVKWSFQNIHMPMVETDDGVLYCTSNMLCDALGLGSIALRNLHMAHKEEFDNICVSNADAMHFMKQHKKDFNLTYVRGDMHLWSENDMILIAVLSRSSGSKEFRTNLVEFIKKHAVHNNVSAAEHEAVVGHLQNRLASIEDVIATMQKAFKMNSPLSGPPDTQSN